jgi:enamine deaminase RidA (YjgF/YER057c/UK114 family)
MTVRRIRSGSPYEDSIGFSRAVVAGDRVLVSGTAPIPPPGAEVAATAYEQALRCGEIIGTALREAGSSLEQVVRTRVFLTDPADAAEVGRAHSEVFGSAVPAATMVVVAGLVDPAWRVEIEAEALVTPA